MGISYSSSLRTLAIDQTLESLELHMAKLPFDPFAFSGSEKSC
jgi:hypothetical protein